jgi:hypothetical protein
VNEIREILWHFLSFRAHGLFRQAWNRRRRFDQALLKFSMISDADPKTESLFCPKNLTHSLSSIPAGAADCIHHSARFGFCQSAFCALAGQMGKNGGSGEAGGAKFSLPLRRF